MHYLFVDSDDLYVAIVEQSVWQQDVFDAPRVPLCLSGPLSDVGAPSLRLRWPPGQGLRFTGYEPKFLLPWYKHRHD